MTGVQTCALPISALTTYVTFLPSFLFILVGAPYVERLQENRYTRNALAAITAAIVGVILNLSVFLATAVFFPSEGVNWILIGAAVIAFGLLSTGRFNVPILVAAGFLIGIAFGL